MWIWQQAEWPEFQWQAAELAPLLRSVRLKQGILLGRGTHSDDPSWSETMLDNILHSVIDSSQIEGEHLNGGEVRSSLAKRIGISIEKPSPTNDRSEGIANIMIDVLENLDEPLSQNRLCNWHHWLFPNPDESIFDITVGEYRSEPMVVQSGRHDNPVIHYEAPAPHTIDKEMTRFINWFNATRYNEEIDPLLRAAITHFWFISIHPFDDGNGRIARALTDLALAHAERQSIRLYAMSSEILAERKVYYTILEMSQRGTIDITAWLRWFLEILEQSMDAAIRKVDMALQTTQFWQNAEGVHLLPEQTKVLNRLLEGGPKGFEQGISAAQYQKVTRVSKATATRHLADLLNKGFIEKLPGEGRSTRYQLRRRRLS